MWKYDHTYAYTNTRDASIAPYNGIPRLTSPTLVACAALDVCLGKSAELLQVAGDTTTYAGGWIARSGWEKALERLEELENEMPEYNARLIDAVKDAKYKLDANWDEVGV